MVVFMILALRRPCGRERWEYPWF